MSPWLRRVPISMSLRWRMPCCAAPAPEPHEPDTARPHTPQQRYPRVARGKCVRNPANRTPSATSARCGDAIKCNDAAFKSRVRNADYPGDQLIDATMVRALHAGACRDHALIAWVV